MRLKRMLLLFKFGRRRRKEGEAEEPPLLDGQTLKAPAWRCFSYEEVHRATDGFNPGSCFVVPILNASSGHAMDPFLGVI